MEVKQLLIAKSYLQARQIGCYTRTEPYLSLISINNTTSTNIIYTTFAKLGQNSPEHKSFGSIHFREKTPL